MAFRRRLDVLQDRELTDGSVEGSELTKLPILQLPDVRALKFDIQYEDRDSLSPGYWFVSPYLHMDTDQHTSLYEQYQTGPHIYDQDGVRRAVAPPKYGLLC